MFGMKKSNGGGANAFLDMAKTLGLGKILPGIVKSYEAKILKAIKDNTFAGERGYIKIKPNKGNEKIPAGTKAIFEIWNISASGKHRMIKNGFVADTVVKALEDSQGDGSLDKLNADAINELNNEK